MKYATLLILAVALASCKEPTAPTPTVNGSWSGTVGAQRITVTMGQTGATVTGSGTMTGTPRGTLAMSVTGTYAHPSLSITLSNAMVQPLNFTATQSAGTLRGSLQGSGFNGETLILVKQ